MTQIYHIQLKDLDDWVKTKAQIGDIAFYHDASTDCDYVYHYSKPDDTPYWSVMLRKV